MGKLASYIVVLLVSVLIPPELHSQGPGPSISVPLLPCLRPSSPCCLTLLPVPVATGLWSHRWRPVSLHVVAMGAAGAQEEVLSLVPNKALSLCHHPYIWKLGRASGSGGGPVRLAPLLPHLL